MPVPQSPRASPPPPVDAACIQQAHRLYCELTGQTLRLGFDRQRMWYELLRLGYTLADLRTVIIYLQRQIRADHRNIGALKLSNLLQPDRFEEDLQISRVRLHPPRPTKPPPVSACPLPPEQLERERQRALECLRKLKDSLR